MKSFAAVTVAMALALAGIAIAQDSRPTSRLSASAPATRAVAATFPVTRLSATVPTAAGHVRMRLYTTVRGKPADLCVVFSTSKLVARTPGRIPALIYLGGAGDRGSNGDGVFRNGPPAEMMRRAVLADSIPMLIVSPQCPTGRQWADPDIAAAVAQLASILASDPRIDPDRIYLCGFSLGGTGCWSAACAGARYFAAISCIAGRVFTPDVTAPLVKDVPIWIICGDKDGPFIAGSRTMYAALQKEGADVIMSELAGRKHDAWQQMYPKLEYYQWFMAYQRGQPPTTRRSAAELLKIASTPILDPLTIKVNKDFQTFAKWWQISNFSLLGNPGLRPKDLGRDQVFVVRPLNREIGCQLQTTWKIPAGKTAKLSIAAGWDGESDWKLVVNIAGRDVLSVPIDETTAADGWYETSLDLGQYSGRDVHIDVILNAGSSGPAPAYLSKLAVEVSPDQKATTGTPAVYAAPRTAD